MPPPHHTEPNEPNEHTRHGDDSPPGKLPPRNPARGPRARAFPANQPRAAFCIFSTQPKTPGGLKRCPMTRVFSRVRGRGRRDDTKPSARRRLRQTPRGRRGRPCSPRAALFAAGGLVRRALPPSGVLSSDRHSGHARTTTTPRLGKTVISNYDGLPARPRPVLCYGISTPRTREIGARADGCLVTCGRVRCFFRHGGRSLGAAPAAPSCSPAVWLRTICKSYEGCRRPFFCCFTEANIGARPSTFTRVGARGPFRVCVPGVCDTPFARAPRFVWRRDLFATLQTE